MKGLAKSVDVLTENLDEFQEQLKQEDEVIRSLGEKICKLHDNLQTAEDELGRQQHCSRRNCLLLHLNEESNNVNTNDLIIKTLNTELNLDLMIYDLDRSHQIRIGNMDFATLLNLTLKI